jgi:hypothetical protein
LGRSPFLRDLMHKAAHAHAMPHGRLKEARKCPGPGRMASRACGARNGRSHL